MSLIKRAKKYFILVSVVMTTALIFLCYISNSFSYVVDHNKKENYFQTNKSDGKVRNAQVSTEVEVRTLKLNGNKSLKFGKVLNSSSIIMSMKEYENLLSDIEKNRKMMDKIWSKTIQNAKEINRRKNDLDRDEKQNDGLDRKDRYISYTTSTFPNFEENKDSIFQQSQDKKYSYQEKISDNSKSKILHEGIHEVDRNIDKYQEVPSHAEKNREKEKNGNFLQDTDRRNMDLDREDRKHDNNVDVNQEPYSAQRVKERYHGNDRGNNAEPSHTGQYSKSEYADRGDNSRITHRYRDIQLQGKVLSELKKFALGQNSRFGSVREESPNNYNVDTDKEMRKDECESCIHNNFKYMINQESLCKHKSDIDVLFIILTAPDEFIQRSTIRETWGSLCKKTNLACMFVLGNGFSSETNNRLIQESNEFLDVVQLDFKEAYANLTYKVLSGFRWASEYCQSAKYVMKTDGDMYVNTELIPRMLQAAPSSKFIAGYCWGLSSPHRNTDSKWYVSFRSYSKSKFPPMCSGTGYIMSMDVMVGILQKSKTIPFFHLEDVYVALCTQKLSVKPVNLYGFSNMRQSFSPCFYRNSVMTSHYVSPDNLREYWSESRKCVFENHDPERLYQSLPYPQVT